MGQRPPWIGGTDLQDRVYVKREQAAMLERKKALADKEAQERERQQPKQTVYNEVKIELDVLRQQAQAIASMNSSLSASALTP